MSSGKEHVALPYKKRRVHQHQPQYNDQTPTDAIPDQGHGRALSTDCTPQGHDQSASVISSESRTRRLAEKDKEERKGRGVACKQNTASSSRSTSTARGIGLIRESFLFKWQLDPTDIAKRRIKIPWDTAKEHFPPPTQAIFSKHTLVSDTRNKEYPMRILNDPRSSSYVIGKGWTVFAAAHNLEARDVVRFYRPVNCPQPYHYLIKCVKANKTENSPAKAKCDGRQGMVRNSSSSGSYKGKVKIYEKEKPIPVGPEQNKRIKPDFIIDGFKLAYLFQKELTHGDAKNLRIPTQDAEKYFPALKQPKGGYKEEKLLVSHTQKERWWMKIKFSLYKEAYMIAGDWSDFVSTHKLQARDVIHVFRVLTNVPNDKHYFFDYVRAGETGTSETPPPRAGKDGSGGGGRGGSKKHHHGGLSISGSYDGGGAGSKLQRHQETRW